jgi:hypothetical protein
MQSNKIIFVLLVAIVFTINSFFILQVKKSVNVLEEENEMIFHQYSRQNKTFRGGSVPIRSKTLLQSLSEHIFVSNSTEPNRPLDPFLPEYVHEESGINSHDFKYLINPGYKVCGTNGGQGLILIAFVPIAVGNFAGRFFIRQTWAQASFAEMMNFKVCTSTNFNSVQFGLRNKRVFSKFKVVFMLGNTVNSTLNKEVRFESEMYGDIVQEDFVDAYMNLTMKTIMGLKWVSTYCSNAKFAMKIDDDVVVNTAVVLHYLSKVREYVQDNTFLCKQLVQKPVKRDPTDKFYLSKERFFPDQYPTCNFICFSSRIIQEKIIKI